MYGFEPREFADLVLELVEKKYGRSGLDVFRRDGGVRDAISYAENEIQEDDIVDETDLRAEVDYYVRVIGSRIEGLLEREKGQKEKTYTAEKRGSLQNIAACATLMPYIVRARAKILGHRRPLTYDEAVAWISKESQKGEAVYWKIIKLQFPVRKEDLYDDSLPTAPTRGDINAWAAYLRDQVERHVQTDNSLYPGPKINAHVEGLHRSLSFPSDGSFVYLDRGKLLLLAEYAALYEKLCGTFEGTVWFILTGVWPRVGMRTLYPSMVSMGENLDIFDYFVPQRIIIEVQELETTPDEIARFYKEVQADLGVGGRGPNLTRETEVIALMALEIKEVEGLVPGDRGFYEGLRALYEREAESRYGVTKGYPGTNGVRQAFKRIENAHAKLVKRHYEAYGDVHGDVEPSSLFRDRLVPWQSE